MNSVGMESNTHSVSLANGFFHQPPMALVAFVPPPGLAIS